MYNQVAYDFENYRFTTSTGQEWVGATGVSYTDKIEGSEKIRGNQREAYDASEGNYEVDDGEITFELWQYQNCIEALGPGFMRKKARFDITVTVSHEGEAEIVDTLQRCRVIGNGKEWAQGDVPMVTVPVQIMKVIHNGIDPMADT